MIGSDIVTFCIRTRSDHGEPVPRPDRLMIGRIVNWFCVRKPLPIWMEPMQMVDSTRDRLAADRVSSNEYGKRFHGAPVPGHRSGEWRWVGVGQAVGRRVSAAGPRPLADKVIVPRRQAPGWRSYAACRGE